MDFEKAK
jgi:hypothetical protein